MIIRPTLLLITLCAAAAVAAPYKWVDKDGNVHYSDKAPRDAKAEQVELRPLTEISATPVPTQDAETDADPVKSQRVAAAAGAYTSMRIVYPLDQATLRGAGIGLSISVETEPSLHDGDSIEYSLDGKSVEASIPFVERGQHTVAARVVGSDGYEKVAATPITIFVFQNIAQPPPPPPKKP